MRSTSSYDILNEKLQENQEILEDCEESEKNWEKKWNKGLVELKQDLYICVHSGKDNHLSCVIYRSLFVLCFLFFVEISQRHPLFIWVC